MERPRHYGTLAATSPILAAWAVAAAIMGAPGCGPGGGEPLSVDIRGAQPCTEYIELHQALSAAVDSRGDILAARESRWAGPLEHALARLAVTGPTATPHLLGDDDARLAYWYNVRAAWSLRIVHLAGLGEEMPVGSIDAQAVHVDGRTLTLAAVDDEIEALGGWMAVVAAPGACLQRAPASRQAFNAQSVRGKVQRRFNALIADDRRLVVDVGDRRVDLPPVLWRYRGELMASHHRMYGVRGANLITVLLGLTEGPAHRRLQDAVGFLPAPARAACVPAIAPRDRPPLF